MSDTVIILSSEDEAEAEKNVNDEHEKKLDGKRHIEDVSEKSKKRRLQPTKLGDVQKKCEKEQNEPSGSSNSDVIVHSEVFNEFIDTCLELDNSLNMRTVIDNKLKKYFSLLIPEYRDSEQFISLMERKQAEVKRSPSQIFTHIIEVVNELNAHRIDKMKSSETKATDHFVRKLCKAMELIHRKIKKIEEKEVDWDDDNDSSYIQLQRYRERLIKLHAKLQELDGHALSGFRRKISFSGTQFPKVNRAIEKFVNTKAEFPDYHDIYNLLKMSYEAEGIGISTGKLKFEAKSVFQSVGEQLQKIRREEFWESHSAFLQNEDDDPAEENETMKNTLEENKKKFQKSIDQIINTYAEKSTKAQFALEEDSNSSEPAVSKEEKPDDDSNAEEDDEDEEEDEEDESSNAVESMDDILNDIEGDERVEDSMDPAEDIFLYCGPVSPPALFEKESTEPVSPSTLFEKESTVDSLSPLPSPGFGDSFSSKNEGETNGYIKLENEEVRDNVSALKKDAAEEPSASCSKWDDKPRPEKSCGEQKESSLKTCSEEPKQNKNKTFIKVRSLSSLQKPSSMSIPEEILLD